MIITNTEELLHLERCLTISSQRQGLCWINDSSDIYLGTFIFPQFLNVPKFPGLSPFIHIKSKCLFFFLKMHGELGVGAGNAAQQTKYLHSMHNAPGSVCSTTSMSVLSHNCNPSTQEVKAEGSAVQSHPQTHSRSEFSLDHRRS